MCSTVASDAISPEATGEARSNGYLDDLATRCLPWASLRQAVGALGARGLILEQLCFALFHTVTSNPGQHTTNTLQRRMMSALISRTGCYLMLTFRIQRGAGAMPRKQECPHVSSVMRQCGCAALE